METAFKFSYKNAVKFSLNNVVENWKTFFILNLAWLLLMALSSVALFFLLKSLGVTLFKRSTIELFSRSFTITSVPALPRSSFYALLIPMGLMYWYQLLTLGMMLFEGKKIEVKDAFSSFDGKTFLKFIGARLLLGLKYMLGLALFIIPGFYFLTKNYFAGYSIMEHPSTSIKEDTALSAQLTKKIQLRLLLVFYVVTSMSAVSFLPLLFSVIFPPLFIVYSLIFPILGLIDVHIYKQMKEARLPR